VAEPSLDPVYVWMKYVTTVHW